MKLVVNVQDKTGSEERVLFSENKVLRKEVKELCKSVTTLERLATEKNARAEKLTEFKAENVGLKETLNKLKTRVDEIAKELMQ